MLIRRLFLLVALSLLAGPVSAASTNTLTIKSFYGPSTGLGLKTVTVNNPGSGPPFSFPCNFTALKTTCSVQIPKTITTVQLVVATKSGFVASGGTGTACPNTSGTTFQFSFTSSGTCSIFAGYPLTVTTTGSGVVAVNTPAPGPFCTITNQSCQLPVMKGPTTLTFGVQSSTAITGGTGLCAAIQPG